MYHVISEQDYIPFLDGHRIADNVIVLDLVKTGEFNEAGVAKTAYSGYETNSVSACAFHSKADGLDYVQRFNRVMARMQELRDD